MPFKMCPMLLNNIVRFCDKLNSNYSVCRNKSEKPAKPREAYTNDDEAD